MSLTQVAATEPERLLEVIALQSAIAAAPSVDAVMSMAAEAVARLTGADAGVVADVDGGDLVVRATSGTASGLAGARL